MTDGNIGNNRIKTVTLSLASRAYSNCPEFARSLIDRITRSSLARRLASGAIWSVAGAVVSRGGAIVAFMVAARWLGKEGFGHFSMIQSTMSMFAMFAGLGLGSTASKFVAELQKTDPRRAGRILALSSGAASLMGIVITLAVFIFAPWLATRTLAAPELAAPLRIASAMLFFGALNGAQTGGLAGLEAFGTLAALNVAVGLLSIPLLLAGIIYGGLTGAIWSLVAAAALGCALNGLALRKKVSAAGIPVSLRGAAKEWRVLWKYSMPAFLCGVMVSPVNWACNAMLAHNPNGYSDLAFYNAALSWQAMIVFIPRTVTASAFPVIVDLCAKRDIRNLKRFIQWQLLINMGVALITALMLVPFCKYILSLYGPGFAEGSTVFIICIFTGVIMATCSVVGSIVMASGRAWLGFSGTFLWAGFLLPIAYIGVPQHGAVALAIAVLISYIINFLYNMLCLRWVISRLRVPTSISPSPLTSQ